MVLRPSKSTAEVEGNGKELEVWRKYGTYPQSVQYSSSSYSLFQCQVLKMLFKERTVHCTFSTLYLTSGNCLQLILWRNNFL